MMIVYICLVQLFLLLSFYVLSHTLLYLNNNLFNTKNKLIINDYSKILLGAFLFFSILAIYITKGITLQSIALLLIFFLFFYTLRYNKLNSDIKDNYQLKIKELSLIIILVILTPISIYFLLNYGNLNLLYIGHVDNHYYTYQGTKMIEYGVEGSNFLSIESQVAKQFRIPYHYFDMWIAGFIYKNSNLSITNSYHYVFIPLTINLMLIASIVLIKTVVKKNSIFFILISLLLIYSLNFSFLSQNFIFSTFWEYYPKHFVSYIVIFLFTTLLLRNKMVEAIVLLWLLPIFNILALPTIGLFSVIVFIYYFNKNKINSFYILFITFFTSLLIAVYYLIFGEFVSRIQREPSTIYSILYKLKTYLFSVNGIELLVYITIIMICYAILHYSRRSNKKSPFKEVYFSFVCLIILGYLLSGLLKFNLDSWQIAFFPAKCVFPIAILFSIINILENTKKKSILKFLAFGLIIAICFPIVSSFKNPPKNKKQKVVSKIFIEEIDSELNSGDAGGYIYDSVFLKERSWAYNPFTLSRSFNFISLIPKKLDNINLSTILTKVEADTLTTIPFSFLQTGEFSQYIKNQNKELTINQLLDMFIDYRKLKYIMLDYNLKPNLLLLQKTKRVIKDSYSGLTILILK